jgi:5,6-dimethylbenzimidazole synthase
MDYYDFLDLAKKRRSTRAFKTEPIPDSYVDKIIEAARWAPSAGNSQPWEFVVVREKEVKDKVIDLLAGTGDYMRKVELTRDEALRAPNVAKGALPTSYWDAPVFILLLGDPRTRDAYPLMASLTRGDANLTSSLASAFLYMHLAATALGLGSQWVSRTSFPYVQPLLKELLGIPQGLEVYDMMALGYAAGQPAPRMVRDPVEMVHNGHYDRAKHRTDEEMRAFIVDLRKSRATSAYSCQKCPSCDPKWCS